ncbi:MAG: hypothetical protein JO139_01690 [Alphaproteobacteria bacterium]|nr:hypothetical protein [Alphaproteobacteria bacterium]MBV8336004.1 hypothetical protein [Alphaproteobacteria bacterium]
MLKPVHVSRASIAPARLKPPVADGLNYPLVFALFRYRRSTAAVDQAEMLSSGWANLADKTRPGLLNGFDPRLHPLRGVECVAMY